MLAKELLDILACPDCKNDIHYDQEKDRLICKNDSCRKAYAIKEDIPIMLIDEAEILSPEDHKNAISS